MKVYIVTDGAYSSYTIRAVFSSKEKAQAFIDDNAYWLDDCYPGIIETYTLDRTCEIDELMKNGHRFFEVRMKKNGDTVLVEDITGEEYGEDKYSVRYGIMEDVLRLTCVASDMQHAIKIANERRAYLIASGEW